MPAPPRSDRLRPFRALVWLVRRARDETVDCSGCARSDHPYEEVYELLSAVPAQVEQADEVRFLQGSA